MNEEEFETNEAVEEQIEVSSDDGLEVEIVDDTPEEDRGRPRRADGKEPEVPDDDEIANYSDNVQSRIKKLRFEYHEERRRKEEAERVREQAVMDMQKLYEENQKLRETLTKGEGALVNQAKGRIAAELEKAKQSYKDAYESGDSDAMIAANERLTLLTNEKLRYESYKPKPVQQQKMPEYTQAPQESVVDDKAIDWASRNEWFQKDKAMTGYAYGIHEELVEDGIDPRSDEYYRQIDSKMREAFPHKFGHQRQQGTVVAPSSRSTKAPRKVTLTQSQVALAKRLGISPEKYAAQLMKETR
jgi:hypothetical protein